jgi:hypothetical protein
MADAKTRKRRLRQRRQQAGLKAALVWLTPDTQAAMAALRQIAARLDIPWTTFRRHWRQLQPEASAPVQADVTELSPRPGPPPVDTSPPARVEPSLPQVHTGGLPEL